MVGLFAVWASRVACLIAMWSVAFPFAHADPAGDAVSSAASSLSKGLEGHLWRIDSVTFEPRSGLRRDSNIYPTGDDGSDAYITFENGEIGGSLGCGQLTGRYGLSDDRVEMSLGWTNERCGYRFRERADKVLSALRHAVRLGRGGENAFHLFDEQKNYFIRLELLNPGFDFSEFHGSFWRLISLEGHSIAEPVAEVWFGRGGIDISMSKSRAEFGFRYSQKKFAVDGPFLRGAPSPLFQTFGQAMQRIAGYTAKGDELAAMDASGQQVMLLRRIRPRGLEYRSWHISEYGADGWLNPTTGFPKFQVITFARGELQGSAGCHGFEGVYALQGESLSVHAGDMSGSYSCSVVETNEQRLVLWALNKASLIKEDGTRMLLQDAQGNTTIVLVPYAQQMPQ